MGRINRNGLDSTYSSISLVLWFRFNYLRIEYSVRVSACNGFFYSFFTFDGKKMLVDAVDFSTVRNIIEFFPPDFFAREIPWIDRNTNRVRFTPPSQFHPLSL